ncbi:MAG: hypothetical protein ACO31E_08450 [Phycisphaerales bacterium]
MTQQHATTTTRTTALPAFRQSWRRAAAACCVVLGTALPAQHASALIQDEAKPGTVPTELAPDAKSIVLRGVAAAGGKDAWATHGTIEMRGTIEMPGQGIKGRMVSRAGKPNLMVTEIEFDGLGLFRTGFDGKTGWASDKIQGTRLMTGKELETIAREADYMKDADPLSRWDSVELIGSGEFSGFDCWKIAASRKAAKAGQKDGEKADEKAGDKPAPSDRATLWYEKSTGLLRGHETSVETMLGTIAVSTTFVEYKEFGGLMLPVRTEARQANQKIVTVFESIAFDTVEASRFALPAEVKALLEPEPAEEGDGDADGDDDGIAPAP